MIARPQPTLDGRDAARILAELLARRPGYFPPLFPPEWKPAEKGSDAAIVQIFARYLEALLQRLNQAPEKNKLAFLDLLGIELIAAQSARLPIVIRLSDQASDGRLPQGTRFVAPPPPESTQQIVFETERAAGLAAAKLTQVVSLWPGRDQYIDHSVDFQAQRAFHPFKKSELRDIPHEIYIAHDTLLALAGKVRLDVEFELTQTSSESLDILWEYWDGQVWRGFRAMHPSCMEAGEQKLDGTNGLTRSGSFRLEADCAETAKTTVGKSIFRLTEKSLENLKSEGVPGDLLENLGRIKDQQIIGEEKFLPAVKGAIGDQRTDQFKLQILKHAARGIEAFWIRAKLTEPLPPNPAQVLPEVESVRLNSVVSRPLKASLVSVLSSVERQGIFGTLTDEARKPLGGATVRLTSPDDPTFRGEATTHPTSGSFDFPVTSAPRRIEVQISIFNLEASACVEHVGGIPQLEIELILRIGGLSPDKAFADGASLDVSKPFYPLGQQPQPGTAFYFANEEIFSKPGAAMTIYAEKTTTPQDELEMKTKGAIATPGLVEGPPSNSPSVSATGAPPSGSTSDPTNQPRLEHTVSLEYWNGRDWISLVRFTNQPNSPDGSPLDFTKSGIINVAVPTDMAKLKVNDHEAFWMRVRLISGGFGFKKTVTSDRNEFTFVITQPPAVSGFRLGYTWQYGPFHPERVLTYNDFQYEDHTDEAKWPGRTFQPFKPVSDITPALYLGFDKKLPVDRLNLYFDIMEERGETLGPALLWEYWNGFNWREFPVEDETRHLRVPSMVSFIAAEDSHPFSRFDKPLHWLRARLREDGPPGEPTVIGIFPNAVWASQWQTITDDPLGTSTGQPNQVFSFRQIPILAGERIEVRELSGPRANVEWRILAMELSGGDARILRRLEERLGSEDIIRDIGEGDLRLRRDRNKRVTEVWLRWHAQEHLFRSGPNDRHYVLERARGRMIFGDGKRGKIPPPGAAILARQYRTGGGVAGNIPARVNLQLQGAAGATEVVFNPRPGEGGADGETLQRLSIRGPKTLSHQGRALTLQDYETMAKEASAAVAVARAVPTRDAGGRMRPGWVTLLIIPESNERRPWPSFGLREQVRKFINERAPADLAAANKLYITGPKYQPIDIEATLIPRDPSEAGSVERRARDALEKFFHPLRGGPEGRGWGLGRDVFLSDVASVLERVEGLDFVKELTLLLNGVPQGERVRVAEDQIVVAGEIRLKLTEA